MDRSWWKECIVYQIYPRSFQDSNGDGIGDLGGILSRLDYLQELGVDVVWLSPIYASPGHDNGYDVSDYYSILKEFGTMEDFDEVLAALHDRGIKLIMDLVVNHTSDEHAWFRQARQSRDNPYRSFYIWKKGKDGGPPNNWQSEFGGSAWEYDGATGEYYLHLFGNNQPDLNWQNEVVRFRIYDMMRWWLDKGIDGFRMDVINCIAKEPNFADAAEPREKGGQKAHYRNRPEVHRYIKEMNREVLSHYEVMTVGETSGITPEDACQYAGLDGDELNMVFQFEHMGLDSGPGGKWDIVPWKPRDFRRVMSKWQEALGGKAWNSLYLNNHDQPRMVSRFGSDGRYRNESAKMLATLLHLMQGTPFIYQGEEIGMTNIRFDSIEAYRDIETLELYRKRMEEEGQDPSEVLELIYARGRDNARTPMQWNRSPNGGFTKGKPWIGVNPNYVEINAEAAAADPDSILNYYKKLIALRKKHRVIVYGYYELVPTEQDNLFVYRRRLESIHVLVVLNLTDEPTHFEWCEDRPVEKAALLIGNYPENVADAAYVMDLLPYEARVYLCNEAD